MIKEIKIPEISENVESGTVVSVLVKVGDKVGADDAVIEFETEKAVVEIPAQVEGEIAEILVKEGDEKKIGDVIAKVETDKPAAEDQPKGQTGKEPQTRKDNKSKEGGAQEEKKTEKQVSSEDEDKSATGVEKQDRREAPPDKIERAEPQQSQSTDEDDKVDKQPPAPAGPAPRRLARELGVDIHEVKGSGPGGRITEADVKAHVKAGGTGSPAPSGGPPEVPPLPDFSRWGEVEIEELTNVRRITAQGTSRSWQIIPHVTQFDEADVTDLQTFLDKNAAKVEKAGGKLTITAVLMKVCASALKRFPKFNASIEMRERRLIYKHYVHIGLMVDTPRGLLVPVVRDADAKSITQLAVDIVDLAGRARNKKIKPDEMEGATFSISNQGGIGGVGFTPVILWPQAAILGVSRASTRAVYNKDGAFSPRMILPLSLSYDHRIIDGADAARFMRFVCESLEQAFMLHL